MDPDVSLPIYHTPWIPVINPDMPTTEAANAAADGSPVTTDAASTSGGLMGRRRRRLLADVHAQTLSKILPTTSALLRGRQEQDPSPIVTIHDFWEFNMESSSWLRIPPNEGTNNPLRRSLHTSIAIGEKMFVFGGVGVDNNMLMNDIWSYDIKTRQWEELDVGGTDTDVLVCPCVCAFVFFPRVFDIDRSFFLVVVFSCIVQMLPIVLCPVKDMSWSKDPLKKPRRLRYMVVWVMVMCRMKM